MQCELEYKQFKIAIFKEYLYAIYKFCLLFGGELLVNMQMEKYLSNSENETKKIAKKFASKLKIGDVVVLTGDLGSGKTKFTEGILEYFDLQDEISSPTFTIVNEYTKNDVNVYHFDVYRLEDEDEFLAIGGEEYFDKGICIIEWGEIIKNVLPSNYIQVTFDRCLDDENQRNICIRRIEN